MTETKPPINRQWRLARRPNGMPTVDDFRLVEVPLPQAVLGEVIVRTVYLSVDPYVRGRMRNVRSYVPPFEIDEVIEGNVSGLVAASRHAQFQRGDAVVGRLGWQDFSVSDGSQLRKISPTDEALRAGIGILGMTGLTAYFALTDVGQPKAGETVLVSGAAGAVGLVAGQIAKILGCRAVGIAGTEEKVRYLTSEAGFDAAINYKTEPNLRKAIRDACPNGVDVYFDNVGGSISDAAITRINPRARIVICGQIASANREKEELGPRNGPLYLLINRARMEGFLIHDYVDRFSEGLEKLKAWYSAGKIRHRETIAMGLEKAPEAFMGLFTGQNIGKQLVKVAT